MATNRAALSDPGQHFGLRGQYGSLEVVRVDLAQGIAFFQSRGPEGPIGPEAWAPFGAIVPNTVQDSGQLWEMVVKELWRALEEDGRIPVSVKDFEVTTDEDSTGNPAIYVKVLVKPGSGMPKPKDVTEWNAFRNLIESALLRLRLSRQPYVQIGEWRRKRA
jgi:hypothetical protein